MVALTSPAKFNTKSISSLLFLSKYVILLYLEEISLATTFSNNANFYHDFCNYPAVFYYDFYNHSAIFTTTFF